MKNKQRHLTTFMLFYIKTFGCQMNFSDSERIFALLAANDFQKTDAISSADLVIFNTCGVRLSAENRVIGQLKNLRKTKPNTFIVITGCLANQENFQKKLISIEKILFLPIKEILELPKLLLKKLRNKCSNEKIKPAKISIENKKNTNEDFNQPKKNLKETCEISLDYFQINPLYEKKEAIFMPIMTGCDNFCSYCIVPYTRGRETSRSLEEIFIEIKTAAKNSAELKEITLLGQNVNSYFSQIDEKKLLALKKEFTLKLPLNLEKALKENSTKENQGSILNSQDRSLPPKNNAQNNKTLKTELKNISLDFPTLLEFLALNFPRIVFGFLTSHPKDFSDELITVIKNNPNLSRHIHLPIQSGNDKILKLMNRPYTTEHYLNLIKKIRENLPDIKLSTDVIVGFPGETERDFEETLDFFQKIKFDEAFINKYSPRPKTAAFILGDPISWKIKKDREKKLRELF